MNLPSFFRVLTLSLICFSGYSQIDLNDYYGLYSSGEIPDDFKVNTLDKYNVDKEKNKSRKNEESLEKEFLLSNNFGIDRILHSGMVVFNDPVSIYTQKVLKKVLKNRPDLLESFRVYTIKSNEPNAFSTRQGILFVTTGLIAQLENEAQLAFILAHEAAHYEKEHVIESYKENKDIIRGKGEFKYTSEDQKIKYLSRYSKKKEFDADYIGLQYYYESDYTLDIIESVFDVLLYSYLPFDEVEFSRSFYNDSALYIPYTFFPEKINEITASENYDDSESSHPNIKNRKEYIQLELEELRSKKKGGEKFIVGEDEFIKIRTICRFESVQLSIMRTSPVSGLYTIYLLQKEFPNNFYLDKMEATAWYKLLKFKNEGLISDITYSKNEIEGASHALHYMVRDFDKEQLNTVAFKRIYSIDKKYEFKNEFIHSLTQNAMEDMIRKEILTSFSHSEQTYLEAYTEFEKSKEEIQDYVNPQNEKKADVDSVSEKKSKYQKIQDKKKESMESTKASSKDEKWDEENFWIYAFADILDDQEFISLKEKAWVKSKEKNNEEDNLTYKERRRLEKKIRQKGVKLGFDNLLILSPEFQKWHFKKGYNTMKSEKGKISLGEMYRHNCDKLDINYHLIDKKAYDEAEVSEINDLNIVMNYIYEFVTYSENGGYYTTEYDKVLEISESRGLEYVVLPFILVEEQKKYKFFDYIALIYPFYWPYFLVKAAIPSNSILITNVVFNIQENKIEYVFSKFFKRKINNVHFVDAHIYDILYQMTAKKKEGGKK